MGFCGSCRMELGLASWLAKINTSLYVVDCGYNMDNTTVAENAVPFLKALRAQVTSCISMI